MDPSNGLRALALAILGGILLACTDPGANAGSSAAPAGASSAPSEPAPDGSAVPAASSGPDEYEY